MPYQHMGTHCIGRDEDGSVDSSSFTYTYPLRRNEAGYGTEGIGFITDRTKDDHTTEL